VGTFTLIFVGAGSIIATHGTNLTAIALAHGLAIGVMASAVGHISGGHFNPAVTLGFLVTKRIEPRLAATYWFAQIVAGIAAAFLLSAVLPEPAVDGVNLGVPLLGAGISPGSGLVIEAVLTFFLMFVIMSVATDTRAVGEAAAIAIGGTVGLDAMFGGPITGASMNPIRSLGPAIVSGDLTSIWVYIAAPALGATIGALTYQLLRGEPEAA